MSKIKYDIRTGARKIKTKTALAFSALALAAGGVGMAVVVPIAAHAAASTVTVTPANTQGWAFNPDPTNATPYQFSTNQASIGNGSLYVLPIDGVGSHKFIATKTLNTSVASVNSISYDFLIAGNGTSADADQFYLNIYTNLPGSTTFYDCRFDYAPTTGSTTGFATAAFNAASVPSGIGDRTAGGDTFVCPATLAGMPSGSTVSFIALNVGDTSTSDAGLAGYLDKVVVNTASNVTTYDFEPFKTPLDKDECKNGGWMGVKDQNGQTFKNQGQCVSWTNGRGQ